MEIIVDAKTVANALGVSDRTVRRLVQEGILLKIKNGQYDLVDCSKRYITHIQEKQNLMDKDMDNLEKELMTEKVLHERAKKRKTELVVAEMENTMHKAECIENLWNWSIANIKSKIRGIPSKVAPQIQYTNDMKEITAILRKEIDETLLDLSNYDPEKFHKAIKDDVDDTDD